ncbi:hypothetical protein BCON_0007g00790 [Botryotinia convoluta]|uniref:Thioester reductase (TE) domain-containing protein n=1 Tax=Botryotinia convoluta TaxID=54673 RepID=A0A4Z1ISF7_9HELO|nr:hypothetical protein BCON_0007g00790 [Botryotinia convoluta]
MSSAQVCIMVKTHQQVAQWQNALAPNIVERLARETPDNNRTSIEPASATLLTTAEQATLIERIWPSIEESSRSAPAHARSEKSFILVVPADRRRDALRRSFQHPDFAISTIYQNPTVSQLEAAILTPNKNKQNEHKIMEALLTTYCERTKTIPVPKKPAEYTSQASKPINVLLTGSTGTIYSYLLQSRTFIKADFESPSLGIDEHKYKSLNENIDLIIHAAWPVNFNLALLAFHPQFLGLVNLLTLTACASIDSTVHLVFISPVAAVKGHTAGPASEEVISDLSTPALAPFSYARVGFLSELLIDTADQHLGKTVPKTIIRIG